ncbi:MAG: hypothetical protein KatS3mg111_0949 [Pirellulaceae bacterium]|nr:MAG: hypothetical protein KatS3mg111_0949 [Pirellulaceae bacterium]
MNHSEGVGQVDSVMVESRVFPPPAEFAARARIKSMEEYQRLYDRSLADPQAFWAAEAREHLHWFEPFTEVLDWQLPFAKWFVGGKTNASYNCLDANLERGHGDRTAIIWEGEPGDTRQLSYRQLHEQVCRFANVLKNLGVQPGDVVSIYMPMTPELVIAMLACARIGAVHSVIFAGFSAGGDRRTQSRCRCEDSAYQRWFIPPR